MFCLGFCRQEWFYAKKITNFYSSVVTTQGPAVANEKMIAPQPLTFDHHLKWEDAGD